MDLASTIHAYLTFGFAIQQLAAEFAFEAAAAGIRGQSFARFAAGANVSRQAADERLAPLIAAMAQRAVNLG